MNSREHSSPAFSPSAGFLAWLWPGLGHISLGERRRGGLIMFGVLFLFFSGLLVGGVDCVDSKNDRLWYLAQFLCGPLAIGANYANQTFVQTLPSSFPEDTNERTAYELRDPDVIRRLRHIGLGHVNEMGTLFVALAGLMNLVVILDALYYAPRTQRPAAAAASSGTIAPLPGSAPRPLDGDES